MIFPDPDPLKVLDLTGSGSTTFYITCRPRYNRMLRKPSHGITIKYCEAFCNKKPAVPVFTCLIAVIALNVGLHLVNSVYQAQLLCWLHNQEEWRDGISVITGIYCSTVQCAVLRIRDIFIRIRILGYVTPTNGSGCGSRRPKNIRILWIRMRIRNTGSVCFGSRRIRLIVKMGLWIRNRIQRQRNK